MPYEVEAFGKIIEVPDDVSHADAYKQIMANKHKLGYDEFTDPENFKTPNPEALDYAKGFAAGANKLVSGVGYLAEAAGAKETGKAIREFGDRGATYWNSKLSPGGKKAAESQVFVDDPESITGLRLGDDAGKALLMGASQSLPSMFAAALPGVAITKGIQALASLGLAGGAGATIPLLAGTAAPVGTAANVIARVPSAIGFGAAEGLVSAGMNAAEFKSSIEGMSDKELSKSPVYLALKAEHGEEKAKQLIADQAASDIFGRTALSTGAIGAVTGGGALGQAYQKATTGAGDGVVKSFFKGAGQEAIQEAPQSGGEKYIENLATKKYLNPELDTMSGVSASAASGGATGAFTGGIFGAGSAVNITTSAQQKADRINAERAKLGLDKIVKSTTVDEAINAANESVSQKPVDKDDVLRVADPTLADIERLTGLKPSESIQEAERQKSILSQAQQENNATQNDIEGQNNLKPKTPRDTEIVLPDNKTLNAQWDIVDADNVKASLKNGESQPRDRTRAASDLQIQSIAKNPDYRRLSDSPVMDIGAPVLSNDGQIVGGNGRFEAISRAYDQDTAQEYIDNLRQDAIRKGIDPAVIDQMKKPVLVRRITQPFDTRQLAIASNSGMSAQYSDLEQAKIDSERLKGLEDIITTDNGDIALTADNIRRVRDALGNYSPAEVAPFVDASGKISQQGMNRIRNAMLAKAYGDNPVIQGLIESNDSDIRNILGALTRVVGDAVKSQSTAPKESNVTPSILEAVNIYNQLKQKNQPISNYLKQQDAFSGNVSPAVENILMFLDKNARSQPKLTEFFRDAYTKLGSIDTKTADIFGEEVQPKPEDLFAKPKKLNRISTFKTSKGSVYFVNDDNTTTRNKEKRNDFGHENDFGLKEKSQKTIYLNGENIRLLGTPSSQFRILEEKNGTYSLLTKNKEGNWGRVPSSSNIKAFNDPDIGLFPYEMWNKETINGHTAYKTIHPGNEIVSINDVAKPTIESQLEKHLKKNGYEFDVNTVTEREFNALSESKKAQKELAEKQAKIFGKKVVFVKTKGKFGINGVMVPAIKDTIFIDLNTPKPFHAVMAHELSHWMEQENPKAYKDMLAALKDIIVNEDGYRRKYNIDDQTEGLIPREIAGDLMGDNFTKPEFWQKVAEYNPSKFKEIAQNIIKWLKNIILKAKTRGMGSEEWVTDAKKAQDIIANAVAQYTKQQDAVGKDIKFHKAFHGSSHDHNKFDSSKIGTGEGAQAYGYGHYFADTKEVAEYYKETTSTIRLTGVDGKKYGASQGDAEDTARGLLHTFSQDRKTFDAYLDGGKTYMGKIARDIKNGIIKSAPGKLYEVELAPKQDEYLLWDKPLSEQSEKVKRALDNIGIDNMDITGSVLYKEISNSKKIIGLDYSGKGSDKAASEYLHSIGIRGIKYLDGSSRAKGEGAYNYVIFDDKDIEIKAKFSKQEQENKDKEYLQAVENGDIEKAQKMVDAAAKDKGYISGAEYRMMHQAPNREDYNLATIKEAGIVPDDYWTHPHYYQSDTTERESFNKVNSAIDRQRRTGKKAGLSVYRAVPKNIKDANIRNGDWVTPSKEYARMEGEGIPGGYRIISAIPNIDNLWWDANSINELGYDDGKEYAYKNTKNNRKLIDAVTYDDDGNVIPLSKRFNSRSDDVRFSKQKLPETLTIDGTERPTRNSEGKPIYPTEEGIRNFWKWFGDSKVVDDQGRPLVVYHGTDIDFNEFKKEKINSRFSYSIGFHFTDSKNEASIYADSVNNGAIEFNPSSRFANNAREGGNIIPSYIKSINPLIVNSNFSSASMESDFNRFDIIDKIIESRKTESPYDGVIITSIKGNEFDHNNYIAFNPNQIKSAIGNTGEFSEENNDIRFSQQKSFNPNEDIPETKAQKAQRIGQDKFNRFRVIKEWLAKEKGINLSEAADVYGAEERYYGKVANQQEDFREKIRNPLIKKISKAGFKLDDVEQYLLNRHAQEANAQNRKLTGKEDSTAYGISDADAQAYLDKAPKELAKLADEVQALTDKAQQLRLDNGIETQERIDAMNGAYKYYVPVRGDAESQQKQNQYKGTGKGFSMKYKPKRRLGHELRNEGVIENIFQDYERAIIQVEDNRMGKSLALMAAEIQMPELISIDQPVKRKILRTDTAFTVEHDGEIRGVFHTMPEAQMFKKVLEGGLFEGKPSSNIKINKTQDQRLIYSASPMLADNEVLVYMNGHEIRLQINDELLARAYKNMGTEALGNILSTGRAINGWMSKAYTGYNPYYILVNLLRDFQTGFTNLTGEQGILIAGKAVANYPKSFASLLKYAFNGKSDKWIDAYRDNGGNTGAAYLPDLERLGEEVKREYASYQGVIANLKEGDSANALRAAGRKAFNATLKYINHLNAASENAFRIATFKAMVESGKSVNEAASMAKNVTVNFNRKGELGSELSALYLFFNPSLQGTAATSHALFKGRHKFQAWGLVGSMMTIGYMMASMLGGFDDEDKYDEISDATKSRNLIMAYGDGYLKIPIPYGYGFFYNSGRMFSEAQRKGELGKMPYQLMALAIEEFSPFNVATTEDSEFSSKKVFYGFLPTMLKIPAEITNNYSSFTNRELYPEKSWYKSEPDNEKMWRGTKGTVYDVSAQYLASIGVEISPEVLKYMNRTATGGSGAFVDQVVSGAMLKSQGAELEAREIPFVNKFYGENTIQDARARYGKAKEEARIAFEKFSALNRKEDLVSVEKFLNDKSELLALNDYANSLSDVIRYIRDQQDEIKLSDQYTIAEKRLKIKELEKEEKSYYDMFMKQYKTVKH